MSFDVETKEKIPLKRPRRSPEASFTYHVVDSTSEAEAERRIAQAYDILFTEVFKKMNSGDKLN